MYYLLNAEALECDIIYCSSLCTEFFFMEYIIVQKLQENFPKKKKQ